MRTAKNFTGDIGEMQLSTSTLEIAQIGLDLVIRHSLSEAVMPLTRDAGQRGRRPGWPPR